MNGSGGWVELFFLFFSLYAKNVQDYFWGQFKKRNTSKQNFWKGQHFAQKSEGGQLNKINPFKRNFLEISEILKILLWILRK